jgi:hypothetical protein
MAAVDSAKSSEQKTSNVIVQAAIYEPKIQCKVNVRSTHKSASALNPDPLSNMVDACDTALL